MPPKSNRPKRNTGPYTSDRVLNAKSPLLSKDLHVFLGLCIASWDRIYQESEKREIIDALPVQYRSHEVDNTGKLICPVSLNVMGGNSGVKFAATKFKEDIENGYYEKNWQTQARKAVQERAEGKFDTYLRVHTENLFGADPKTTNAADEKQGLSSQSAEAGEIGAGNTDKYTSTASDRSGLGQTQDERSNRKAQGGRTIVSTSLRAL